MKKKAILIITILTIILLTGCDKKVQNNDNTTTTKKSETLYFASSYSDVLLSYGNEIFDKKEYLNYKTNDNEYYISLKNLKELGYETRMFVNENSLKECDSEKTGITMKIVKEGTYDISVSAYCE